MNQLQAVHQEIIAAGRQLSARGLVWGCSGNISLRTSVDVFFITATGADLGALDADNLAECRVSGTSYLGPTPSRETGLHRAIYQTKSGVRSVIHTSPFYTTLVACCQLLLRVDLFPEAIAYLDQVAWVPYHHPGSRALADAVAAGARESTTLILANHGAVALGQNLNQVLLRLETLEFLCRMEVTARSSGLALHYLGAETAQAFCARYRTQQSEPEGDSPCGA